MNVHVLLVIPLAMLGCCGSSADDVDAAAAVFERFQAALQHGDEHGCRKLLTSESQAVLAAMPWDQIAARKPLRVVAAQREHRHRSRYVVDVEDPNEHGASGQFFVVREHGRLVVDLVASAGRNAVAVEAAGSPSYEPRALTPADHDRIRRHELSQPRGR